MPPLELPLEVLLMIAHLVRDDHAKLRYGDFNSFLQVNRVLRLSLSSIACSGKKPRGTRSAPSVYSRA
jgi:hypothetical protein